LRPVIVYVHSGGWITGDRSSVPDVMLAQVARGYALVSIDYQLATVGADGRPVSSFPGAIWDVKRAIRYIKSSAAAWNVEPRQVILTGASAGGYLAAFVGATAGQFEPPDLPTTATRRIDSSVEAIVDLVGPSDLETFERTDHPWAAPLTASFLGCSSPSGDNLVTCPDGIIRAASVAPYVDSTDPPIFLAYGALDDLVVAGTQGEPLARLWVRAHHGNRTSATYDVVEGAGHTLQFDDTVAPLTDFFDRVTQGPGVRGRV
jgi:acetyl esterase/lipase